MLEDFIPLLLASGLLLAYLFVLSFITPALGLAAVILVSIMIPIEISLQWGQLPRIGPTRIVAGIFLIAYLLRLCVSTTNHRQNFVFPKDKPFYLMYFLLLYVCTILVSYMFSVNVKASTFFIIDQFVVFAIFCIYVNEIRKDENWIIIKQAIYFGTIVVCFFAFFEVWTRANPIIDFIAPPRDEIESIVRLGLWRVRSTFYHPIALGVFLNLVFPFVLVDLLNSGGVKRLRLTVLALLMCVVQILTVSRIPWLVMIFEAAIVFIIFSRITLSKIILILNISMIGAVALFVIYSSSDFIHKLFEPFLNWGGVSQSSSEYYRIALTRAVLDSLTGSRWIYGFGPGTFQLAGIQSNYAGSLHVLNAPDLHYIRVLADLGLLGLGAFIALLLSVLATCIGALRSSARRDAAACVASVIGFILVNATVSMFYFPLALVFWLAVARAIALCRQSAHSCKVIERRAGVFGNPYLDPLR